ncbi:hypothetical protein HNY73_000259 [Argiope bruennichi]|uniref:Uncharacterized protein n=1 Tax=Argiope bruennichi TaxID=94029 RepID=A0A8T0FYI5_ARGBR|nr:hypothetical protein HNY73_000259 [Argiope bruennichi]
MLTDEPMKMRHDAAPAKVNFADPSLPPPPLLIPQRFRETENILLINGRDEVRSQIFIGRGVINLSGRSPRALIKANIDLKVRRIAKVENRFVAKPMPRKVNASPEQFLPKREMADFTLLPEDFFTFHRLPMIELDAVQEQRGDASEPKGQKGGEWVLDKSQHEAK